MLDRRGRTVFWVEKIALTDIPVFLVQSCFADIRVNYDRFQQYPLAARAISFLDKARLNRIFFPVELRIDRTDADGFALNYRVEKELNDCIEGFFSRHVPQESRRFKDTLKSYIASVLQGKVIFVTMAASEINSKKAAAGENNVICLDSYPLNHMLCGFYRDRGFSIRRPAISVRYITFYIRPFYHLACFLLCKLGSRRLKSGIPGIRPAVWVEYYPGYIHAFWINKIKAQGFDVVSYFDRNDTQITPKTLKEIEGRGSKWIDAYLPSLIRMSRLSFSDFKGLISALFLATFSRLAWLKAFRFEHDLLFLIYRSVFRRYKVKVLIQHQECSWKQGVQALAIEGAGGIMVGYHWSAYPYYMMSVENFPQHVYFAWGKMMGELLGKKDVAHRHILPSGIWGAVNGPAPDRKSLFAEDVDFVISVFDSEARYNLFQSPDSLSAFYLRILNMVKNSPGFGCIIKSKQLCPKSLLALPAGKEIIGLVEMLRGQKRLVIFDPFESPLAAASLSDLSVGYGINSACAIAATIGNRAAVNWDCSGFKRHPFYKYPEQKIVFKTLDALEEAILKASKGDKEVGDYSRWEKHINHFGDFCGIDRVADFLESYMKESMDSGDPGRSLDLAMSKYCDGNKVGEDFHKKEGLWEDE